MDAEQDLYDLRGLPGEGKTEMVIFADKQRTIVRFREPMLWVAFDPSNAVQVGKRLIDCAVECGAKVEIQLPKRKITEAMRARMINRAAQILRSLQEKNRPPAHIVREIVDAVLYQVE